MVMASAVTVAYQTKRQQKEAAPFSSTQPRVKVVITMTQKVSIPISRFEGFRLQMSFCLHKIHKDMGTSIHEHI